MSLITLVKYIISSLGYALLPLGLAFILLRSAGRKLDWGGAGLILSTAFVIFLAISPFPDPGELECINGGVDIQTEIFGFLEAPARLWASGASLGRWLTDLTVTSTIMNLTFFAVVGFALGTQVAGLRPAFLFGFGLSFGIETLQFTGLLGLYPCRYRTVDVDDLIMNVAGVVLGAGIARWYRLRSIGERGAQK